MLSIDGRAGGGQVLRTALSLSAITGTAVELERVRGARPEPGLKPQHLAAVEVLAGLCDAAVDGAELGSSALTFEPGALAPESADIDLRTAGSVTLVFDAVFPLASRVDEPFEVSASGGTDVKWAPTVGALRHVKRPLLERFGWDLDVDVGRTGFYPAGGGEATLRVRPATPAPFGLPERGDPGPVTIYSKASADLADADVAQRQADRAAECLEGTDRHVDVASVDYVETRSPGSVLLLSARYERSLAGFDALGERGKPAEDVAEEAVDALLAFEAGPGAVDHHLADQLLVSLALAGGVVLAPTMTDHLASNAAVIKRFGYGLAVHERDDGSVLIEAEP